MYGLIFSTLRSLVINKLCGGNEDKWKEICSRVGVDSSEKFRDHDTYDECIMFRIVAAACEVLDQPRPAVMELFGEHFFEVTSHSGHQKMLRTLGHDLYGFLVNLDYLHGRLSYTYEKMEAPSFMCEKTDSGLLLHYYSKRKGLHNIVVGIVKAAAKEFYSLTAELNLVSEEVLNSDYRPHHYVFEIRTKESSLGALKRFIGDVEDTALLSGSGFPRPYTMYDQPQIEGLARRVDQLPEIVEWGRPVKGVTRSESDATSFLRPVSVDALTKDDTNLRCEVLKIMSAAAGKLPFQQQLAPSILPELSSPVLSRRGSVFIPGMDGGWPVTQHLFRTCFPFHIIFDKDLIIRFMGTSINRLLPNAIRSSGLLTDYFEMERAIIPSLTYQNIRSHIHNEVCLRIKDKVIPNINKMPEFRGQMVPTSPAPNSPILFLASPKIHSFDELKLQGLYLSDVPIHDVTRDLILLNRQLQAEMSMARELEIARNELEREKELVQRERNRADALLCAMLPNSIAMQLKSGEVPESVHYDKVTILFSDIQGFTTICNKCQPIQVVDMLNNLYTKFDEKVDEFRVYKVETIGDAYMTVAGMLDTSPDHAYAITMFAFSMREAARQVPRPTDNTPLAIRIGIHSGSVVAGVVGKRMPRYCLFGDTVNQASRMESHGEAGKIHLSESTYNCLIGKPLKFINRGLISIKGLEQPRRTFFVEPLTEGEESMTIMMPVPSGLFPLSGHGFGQNNTSFLQLDNVRRATISVPGSETGHGGRNLLTIGDESRKVSTDSSEQSMFSPQGEENGIMFTVDNTAVSLSTKQRSVSLNNNQIHPELMHDTANDTDQKQAGKTRSRRRRPKCAIV